MTVSCSPLGPIPQIELADGLPAVGGKLFFYVAGSVNTKQSTYTDSTGTVANTNPIVLNALGNPANAAQIWFTSGLPYKVVYAPSTDTDPPTSPIWSVDNLYGIDSALSASGDQWIPWPVVPTYVSATSFTVPGDQTGTFQVGRRVKTVNSGGTIYSTIATSVYGALTTVTVVNDSGILDAGLSSVAYGIISSLNTSDPFSVLAGPNSVNNTSIQTGAVDSRTIEDHSILIDDLNQEVVDLILSSSQAGASGVSSGNGRLTLVSGAPVMTSDVTGATTVYYAASTVLLNNGTGGFNAVTITELSQALSDTTKSPAASAADNNYDIFAWDDAGTERISRGPPWRNAGQVITGATNATPIVITANSHGLSNGDDALVSNVGGNTAANGTWVVANVAGNTFELVGSVGNGAYTSGTGTFASRGQGTGTTAITLTGSTYVNTVAITNGPAALYGTWLGTVHTNGSNQLDWLLGSAAVGGGQAYLSVWNASNQVAFETATQSNSSSWTYGTSTIRAAEGSSTFRCSFVKGLVDKQVRAEYTNHLRGATGGSAVILIGLNSTTVQAAKSVLGQSSTGGNLPFITEGRASYAGFPGLGFGYISALEWSNMTSTFYGATAEVPGYYNVLFVTTYQ